MSLLPDEEATALTGAGGQQGVDQLSKSLSGILGQGKK